MQAACWPRSRRGGGADAQGTCDGLRAWGIELVAEPRSWACFGYPEFEGEQDPNDGTQFRETAVMCRPGDVRLRDKRAATQKEPLFQKMPKT